MYISILKICVWKFSPPNSMNALVVT